MMDYILDKYVKYKIVKGYNWLEICVVGKYMGSSNARHTTWPSDVFLEPLQDVAYI